MEYLIKEDGLNYTILNNDGEELVRIERKQDWKMQIHFNCFQDGINILSGVLTLSFLFRRESITLKSQNLPFQVAITKKSSHSYYLTYNNSKLVVKYYCFRKNFCEFIENDVIIGKASFKMFRPNWAVAFENSSDSNVIYIIFMLIQMGAGDL